MGAAFGPINFNGGDLGVGFEIDKDSLQFLVEAVANELGRIDYGPYKFAFRLNASEFNYKSSEITQLLTSYERLFPSKIKFYSLDGQKIFAVRGPSGGIFTQWVVYIYQEG